MLCLLSLLLTLGAQGIGISQIRIDPPVPDAEDTIELRVTGGYPCLSPPRHLQTSVKGSVIDARVWNYGGGSACADQPTGWDLKATVGSLAPGRYTIQIHEGLADDAPVLASKEIEVLPATDKLIVRPNVLPVSGGKVRITLEREEICGLFEDCDPLKALTFGGIAGTSIVAGGPLIDVIAPPHAAGQATVHIEVGAHTYDIRNFHYFDPHAAPDPEVFDRVLFPVAYTGPGALGSQWTTDVILPKGLIAFEDPVMTHPEGLLYFPARGGVVHYSLHVRNDDDLGADVPVIHTRDTNFSLAIDAIPRTASTRRTLRIYDLDQIPRLVHVEVTTAAPGSFRFTDVVLTNGSPTSPAYALLDLDSLASPVGDVLKVTVRTDYGARLWAMVSAADNVTQRVTLFMPAR